MEQKKKFIIGGSGLAVTVIVLVLLFWLLSKPNILVADEPKFDVKDLRNMAPEDGSALAAFQGYVRYLPAKYGNKQYLALAPVIGVQVAKWKANQDVKFDSMHASVSLGISVTNTDFYIKNITVETKDGDRDKTCYVNNAAIFYDKQAHYECLKPLPMFPCVSSAAGPDGKMDGVMIAELVISAIRVEVNGNVDDHKKGKFTTGAKFCDIV